MGDKPKPVAEMTPDELAHEVEVRRAAEAEQREAELADTKALLRGRVGVLTRILNSLG